MIKILIGGSPCTKWSIAQKNGRETEPSGEGWELFRNYSIAKQKFNPDFFLYENNKSAAQAIKDQISKELGVKLMHINSALVSAQNRQRFYAFNWEVEQPEDRGILLKDILEGGTIDKEKSYCLKHQAGNTRDYFKKHHTQIAYEPVAINTTDNDYKARTLMAGYYKYGVATLLTNEGFKGGTTAVAEPCCVAQRGRYTGENGEVEQNFEVRGNKTNALTTVSKDNLIAEPLNITPEGKSQTIKAQYQKTSTVNICCYSSTYGASGAAEPVRVGALPRPTGELSTSAGMRIYNTEGKGRVLIANGGGQGAKTGLYAIPIEFENGIPTKAISCTDGKTYTVYEVKDGFITIKGKQYPIKLADGYYIIRKLTVKECCRLQTMPDDYFLDENGEKIISDSQAYKCLGNGWTAEVIIHILQGALKDVPKDEEIIVLSMYDGIATGRYCLDKMGFTNVKYYAYEIDPYAIKVATTNYPDIIQCGNAFDLRKEDWRLEI